MSFHPSGPCILFFDWDRTVRVGPNNHVSPENIEAIRAVQALGHRIVLNTGRAYSVIPKPALELFDWDGIIAGFSFVRTKRKILYEKYLPKTSLLAAVDLYERTGIVNILEGRDTSFALGGDTRFLGLTDDPREYIRKNHSRMMINNMSVQTNTEKIPDHFIPYCSVIYHEGYSEYMCKGFDKAFGMKILCEHFGIPPEDTVAFGDSENDLEMLRFAGRGVMMKSADERLEPYADYRSADDETGVAEAIRVLFPDVCKSQFRKEIEK